MANVTRLQTSYTTLPVEAPQTAPPGGGMPPQDGTTGVSARQILGTLRRHKLLIGGLALVGTTIAWLVANQLTPIYQSQGELVIEAKASDTLSKTDGMTMPLDYQKMETEAARLRSEKLARITVRKLNLIEDPLFNPDMAPPPQSRIASVFAPVLRILRLGGEPPAPRATLDEARRRIAAMTPEQRERMYDQIADLWALGLTTQVTQASRVMTVRYRSPDPRIAANSVNEAIRTYIDDQKEKKGQDALGLAKFLASEIEGARRRNVDAERKLAAFRSANEMYVDSDSMTTMTRTLLEMRTQWLTAERAATEAELRVRNGGGVEGSGSTVLQEVLIAEKDFQALAAIFGPEHPEYKKAAQRLGAARARLGAERSRGGDIQKADAKALRDSAEKLKTELNKLEVLIKKQTEGSSELRTLQAELETSKQLYQTLLARLQTVDVESKRERTAEAEQITEAAPAVLPVAPRKDVIVLMAFLASIGLGVAVSIIIELMDSGFRSIHQLEQHTGVAALGMVPFQSNRLRRNSKPWLSVVDKPNSAYSEALRTIRTGIALSSADHPQRTVVVTSSVPGEGKTTTSLSLASASAASGARTLIIDCDMRQPSLHKNLGVENTEGLAEFLAGQKDLEELVHVEPKTGLYYVLAGKRPPSPTDLLGSLRMRRLLEQLAETFDLVILDTPPVLAVSDALLLVRQTDTTIFVVRWEKTRRDVATAGVKMVYEAGARLSGIVLSQVDLRRHAQYDYTDSGVYYYQGYKRYYGEG
ncbi:MAG: polysaccharide biosynthesis tyrosine autokinase [Rhodospirillales bacterium]|nr:MAG: polysaccharide biosynthesis tyrosine autokinase [Rhodospirillales bacterium]